MGCQCLLPALRRPMRRRTANGAIAAADRSPLARLKQYLDANIPHGLIDLRDPATELPENHDHDNSPGYIGIHDKEIEIWFSNVRFEKIAGGKREGQALKTDPCRDACPEGLGSRQRQGRSVSQASYRQPRSPMGCRDDAVQGDEGEVAGAS